MTPFDFHPRTRVVFGAGALDSLGPLAREASFKRTLVVADHGVRKAGYVERAMAGLAKAGIAAYAFHDFSENPDTAMVEAGRAFATDLAVDSLIGLGGGSSMDCAKAINFLLTNGGAMRDYHGYGKAATPLLPMIGIPTTAGTGSEAQSYALISDAATHVKMACGDLSAAFRIALLDPVLAATAPRGVRAAAGYDALSHAVETAATTRRNAISDGFSRHAWRLLERNFECVVEFPEDVDAMGEMQVGAFLAGLAIENSMLGAAHACANPLTARYGITHGVAIAIVLRHVVDWNGVDSYRGLHDDLPARLTDLAEASGLPMTLRHFGVQAADFASLAADAAGQWTGRFNPRPFDAAAAMEIYECAY